MGHGAIIRIVSTVVQQRAAPADTAPRTTVRIPTPPAHGASIAIRSIAEARRVPAAGHRPMTMPTTAIPIQN